MMGAATRSARLAAILAWLSILSAGIAVVLAAIAEAQSTDSRLRNGKAVVCLPLL